MLALFLWTGSKDQFNIFMESCHRIRWTLLPVSWYSLKTISLAARLSKNLFQHGYSANNNKKYFSSSRYYTPINLNLNATWSLQLRGRIQIRFQYLLTLLCSDSHGGCSSCSAAGEMGTCRSVSLPSGSVFSKASAGWGFWSPCRADPGPLVTL